MRIMTTRLRNVQSNKTFIVFPALVVSALLVAGCKATSSSEGPDDRGKSPCNAELFTVKVENGPRIITLSAFTEPFSRTSPAARVMARVTAVSVREGDRVASDMVLARPGHTGPASPSPASPGQSGYGYHGPQGCSDQPQTYAGPS